MEQTKIDILRTMVTAPGSMGLTHEKQLELLRVIEYQNKEIDKLQIKQETLF